MTGPGTSSWDWRWGARFPVKTFNHRTTKRMVTPVTFRILVVTNLGKVHVEGAEHKPGFEGATHMIFGSVLFPQRYRPGAGKNPINLLTR